MSLDTGLSRIATVQEASSGIKANTALDFGMDDEYEWKNAPYSPFGEYWSTETYYHPLIRSTPYKIASTLTSIKGDPAYTPEQKDLYRKQVKEIVLKSERVLSRSWMYLFMAFSIISIIILVTLFYISGQINSVFLGIFGIFSLLAIASYIDMQFFADSRSRVTWDTFTRKFSSALNTGKTVNSELNELENDDKHAEEMARKYANTGTNFNTSSFSGSLVGSLLGSFINKKN